MKNYKKKIIRISGIFYEFSTYQKWAASIRLWVDHNLSPKLLITVLSPVLELRNAIIFSRQRSSNPLFGVELNKSKNRSEIILAGKKWYGIHSNENLFLVTVTKKSRKNKWIDRFWSRKIDLFVKCQPCFFPAKSR